MNRVLLTSAVAAAFAFAAQGALAQSSETVVEAEAPMVLAAAGAGAGEATSGQRAAPDRRVVRSASDCVEARLAYIRTSLKITDAQQPQWEGFANLLRKHARDMDQRFAQRRAAGAQQPGARDFRNVSAIERLERRQQRMAERSVRLNEVIGAAKPLYVSLSPEQKQIADEMLARQGNRGGHRHHHRGMHRGA